MRKITLPRGSIPYGRVDCGSFRSGSPWVLPFVMGFILLSLSGTVGAWPITIVTQPSDVIDCEDHVVSFRVVISGGTDPVTYTWQRKRPTEADFTDIPVGAPNISYPSPGTLRVANVGSYENPGGTLYRVVVSDPGGSVTSAQVLLTVNEITDIIPSVAIPSKTNVILCEGAVFSYTVTTSGTTPVAFQWKKYAGPGMWNNVMDNSVISGSNTAVLLFTGATPAESGEYRVNITFHSSGADCQVQSDDRTRRLTVQGNLTAPVIQDVRTLCQGIAPDPLTALPAGGGSGSFDYQWQSSPDNVVWTDITGATSLTYPPPPPSAATWYRVNAVDNGTVSCGSVTGIPAFFPVTDCFNLHYRTIASGEWHDRTIWETSADGITWGGTAYTFPTADMLTITICGDHLVTVTHDVSVDQVSVNPGGAVTVAAGATLTNIGPASQFVIHSGGNASGSLIVNGSFSGVLSYKRYLDPSRWFIIASPVHVTSGFTANNTAINFNTDYQEYDFAWYKEEGNEGWIYYASLPDGLDSGKGYVTGTAVTQTPEEGIVTFAGSLNGLVNDTVSPMVYLTSARYGWNAVGNPFTSAIGVSQSAATSENFLDRNAGILEDSYAAIYVWNETGLYDGSQQYYKAIGNSGYNFPGFSYYGGSDPAYLQSGQGFLVNVKATARAVFSGAMQVHKPLVLLKSATLAEEDPGKESPADGRSGWQGMTLVARQGHRERRAVIAFHRSMTTGLDKTYDAGLFPSDDFRVYTRLVSGTSGADLEIQCLPDRMYGELVVPVGLDLPDGGEVTFSAEGVILPPGWAPLLEDRFLQTTTPLEGQAGSYPVTLNGNPAGPGRFYLRFGKTIATAVSSPHLLNGEVSPGRHGQVRAGMAEARFKAWFSDGKIKVTGNAGPEHTAQLFDLHGRTLGTFLIPVTGRLEIPVKEVSGGVYLLRIVTGGKVQLLKVVVAK